MPVVQEMEISGIERRTDGRTAAVQFSMRGVQSTFDRPIALSVGPSASQPNRISDGRDVFSAAGVAISRRRAGVKHRNALSLNAGSAAAAARQNL